MEVEKIEDMDPRKKSYSRVVEPEVDEEEVRWLDEKRKIVRVKNRLLMPRIKPDPLRHTTELLLKR